MEKYKINGKPITMPTGWHDVTFKQACNIIENNLSAVEIFSIFSGIDKEEVENLNRGEDIYYFLKGFPFLDRIPIEDKPSIPKSIKYKGEKYSFPHILFNDPYDFGDTSVGQIEDMKAVTAKKVKEFIGEDERDLNNMELIKIYPYVVAIYIQPIIAPLISRNDKSTYSYKRAMKIAEELGDQMSFKEVVYMGNFFLMKLGSLTNGSSRAFLSRNWIVKKLRLAYKKLIRILDSMLP